MKMRTEKHAKYVHDITVSNLITCLSFVVPSDLLPDILCRLPIKSLIKFSSVCKQWHTLITKDSRFRRLLLSNQKQTAIGLQIWSSQNWFYEIKYLHLSSAPKKIIISQDWSFHSLEQSCNGLLLCTGYSYSYSRRRYFVCNPITKQYLRLAEPHADDRVYHMSLAFDPSKSPYYKIVAAVRFYENYVTSNRIFIYSSDTRLWKLSGCDTEDAPAIMFGSGVFWNGAINWVSESDLHTSFYLNLENEILKPLPSLPRKCRWENAYCGESRGHFHFVEIGVRQIEVFEMKTDYSEWSIMYNIDLSDNAKGEFSYLKVKILSIVCGEDESDSFLVLRVPGKVIRFNLATNTCQKLHDVEGESLALTAFHFIESLCSV